MITGLCCVYNVTRGCRLNSKVTVVDSAREPLKVLKILIEGLARDGQSSLWLTPLLFTPNIMRLFPFDFAYLDGDLKVIEGIALPPGIPLPQFNSQVASALILPFNTFSSTGTCAGDRLIVCSEEDLEARIAEITTSTVVATPVVSTDSPIYATELPLPEPPQYAPSTNPLQSPQVSLPNFAGVGAQGIGSTLAMTSSWQISTSTMTAVQPDPPALEAIPEFIDAPQQEPASDHLAVPDTGPASILDTETPKEIEAALPETAQSAPAEIDTFPTCPLAPEPSPIEPEDIQKQHDAPEASVRTDKPTLSRASSEVAPVIEQAELPTEAPQSRSSTLKAQRKNDADKVPATAVRASQPDSAKAKESGSQKKKKKDSLGVLVKRFLNCEDPLPERRSIIRLLSKELLAYPADSEKTGPYEIRDVSPTGLYLRTQERWAAGSIISLALESKHAKEPIHEGRVRVQVRTVRCDDGGIGLSWVWPGGVEFQPWKRLHTKRSDETDADYFLRELRLTSAIGFLCQICPSTVEEIKLALHQRLSNKRVASAVEIALKAQKLLAESEHVADKLAHPDMVRRILENGSWTADDWIRQWWAGLLVSSCSPDGLDTSNSVFIDLLAKLMPAHLHVLKFVCILDIGSAADGQAGAKRELYCTADELIEAVGSPSLARIQQTMGQLSSLGLLAEHSNPSYISVTDKGKTRIEPTALGVNMYARCNGRR
ncbi:hypothetical protein P8935_03870 [Telmatobacter sp. DSM 110680]|uniref:PilZ domain-containing protein n=1 Tax=Telmatobacter sp. DSM 110680 TaxID=3036704 RepID=A0AAU7DMF8_9BACT